MQWPWRKAETELEREVQDHLDALADAFERQGMSRDEATQRARAEFGGVDRIKEQCRDESRWNGLTQIGQDIRFGWRMMRKTPAITLAAVASLALGIGATTAILSVADAVLWRTIAAPAPEQLVELFWESRERPDGLFRGSSGSAFRDGPMSMVADFFSKPSFEAMRSLTSGKAQVAGHIGTSLVSTSFQGRVLLARVRAVTGNFFSMLQLQPFSGRLLSDNDDDPAAPLAVVVTHRFWVRHFAGNAEAVGQTIRINNNVYSIAGILPAGFLGIEPGDATEIYTSISHSPQLLSPDSWHRPGVNDPMRWWIHMMARRAPGIASHELRTVLDAAFASSWVTQPKSPESTPKIRTVEASRGLGSLRRGFGDPVLTLLGLVTVVLLVACANIANLMLARAVEREKEVALRVSLGCGQARLVRQFFTESLMLAALGGALSIAVAASLGKLMIRFMPEGAAGIVAGPDARSLAGTAAVTLFTALLFGLYPAWRAARVGAAPMLKEGSGSGGTLSRSRWAPARLLVLVQVSLGVLLVTAAIVFTSHLNQILNRETGFERGHLLLFDVRPGEIGYQRDRLRQFYFDLESRLAGLPGVEAVGLALTRPMRGGGRSDRARLVGSDKGVGTSIHYGSPSFLAALGVPVIGGRAMNAQEARTGAKVAVISENLAKELEMQSPLGTRLQTDGADYEVIGVVRTARYSHMVRLTPVAYLPFDYARQSATVVVRTAVPPLIVLGAIRRAVKDMDRDLPLVDIFTMEQQISRTLQRERLFAWLCGSFGVLALVLCVVGLYGLMSHTTARRTPEIGIRIALGASRGDVLGQVLFEGMRLAAIGLVLGVPLAIYGAQLAQKQRLVPEGPLPYWTLAAAIGILALSALAAVLAPAMRASSIDPMRALRRG